MVVYRVPYGTTVLKGRKTADWKSYIVIKKCTVKEIAKNEPKKRAFCYTGECWGDKIVYTLR